MWNPHYSFPCGIQSSAIALRGDADRTGLASAGLSAIRAVLAVDDVFRSLPDLVSDGLAKATRRDTEEGL